MEQLKVLVAALALREFTVDEISGLSGVNTSTVRSVLKRNAELFRRADARGDRDDVANSQRGRGRPANRWVVVDCEKVRRLVDEMGALPKFEPSYANVEADDWRLVAVSVAEDALAQVSDESDPELQVRLLRSARSSLFFAESGDSLSNNVPWWQTEDSLLAVRARGVDALVNLASLVPSQRGSSLDALSRTARRLAAAMLAVPDRAEATYFAPFSQILARSGRFAPMYALSAPEQEPLYQLADDWTEVEIPHFRVSVGRVLTQAWAEPLVNVSASMPVVISSRKLNADMDQIIDGIKMISRPAVVFGPPDERRLIRKSGRVGASFIPVKEPLGDDRQYAIDSVVALIDRFSIGR